MSDVLHDTVGMTRDQKIEYLFVQELHFECYWFMHAWEELHHLEQKPLLPSDAPPEEHGNPFRNPVFLRELDTWGCVDRVLTHATRIDRLLNPDRYASQDDKESRNARKIFSRIARKHLPANVFSSANLKSLRDATEHLNERLYRFMIDREINKMQPFGWGSDGVATGQATRSVRGFDSFSGVCVVMGIPVDLSKINDWVRRVKFALPEAHMGPTRLSLPIGVPEVSDHEGRGTPSVKPRGGFETESR